MTVKEIRNYFRFKIVPDPYSAMPHFVQSSLKYLNEKKRLYS